MQKELLHEKKPVKATEDTLDSNNKQVRVSTFTFVCIHLKGILKIKTLIYLTSYNIKPNGRFKKNFIWLFKVGNSAHIEQEVKCYAKLCLFRNTIHCFWKRNDKFNLYV